MHILILHLIVIVKIFTVLDSLGHFFPKLLPVVMVIGSCSRGETVTFSVSLDSFLPLPLPPAVTLRFSVGADGKTYQKKSSVSHIITN